LYAVLPIAGTSHVNPHDVKIEPTIEDLIREIVREEAQA